MKACKLKQSAFNGGKYSLISYRPLSSCKHTTVLVPIRVWAAENNYSYKQAKNLIKKRLLMAKKHKKRWYVAAIPDFEKLII